MSDETFDVWPHDPTQIVKEALREYVGDGDGEDDRVLAAHEKRVRERIAQDIRTENIRHWREHRTTAPVYRNGYDEAMTTAARIVREGA